MVAVTTTSFARASAVNAIRSPSKPVRSICTSLRVTRWSRCGLTSRNVDAPGSAQVKRTVLQDSKVVAPWARSSLTRYPVTSMRAARAPASKRVRLVMPALFQKRPQVAVAGRYERSRSVAANPVSHCGPGQSLSVPAVPRSHRLQAGNPFRHRRVGREQPRDVLGAKGVGDHHVTGVDEVTLGRQRCCGRTALELAQR